MTRQEYTKLVLADFEQKLQNKILPLEMVSPTRKSLKKHSYNICLKRFDPKDELLISSFFGERDNFSAYANAIDLSSAEKFRTLHNFLSDKTETTDFTNIDILAWLIDFQPRPYSSDININTQPIAPVEPDDTLKPDINKPIDNSEPKKENTEFTDQEEIDQAKQEIVIEVEPTPGKADKKKFAIKIIIADKKWLLSITTVLILGIFTIMFLTKDKNCMYWKTDRYMPTPCDVPRLDTPFIHLDAAKLHGFRRLHHVDTLTYNSVGKFYYVRIGKIIEVYTAEGKHPLYPDKTLKPLTYYAVNVCRKQHDF